ncbi:MAG: hypothetical protein DWQ02_24080 [Bacteroidetes bacterium]|nr:MAG: hypothetical protein DWQ02_24080 [Bacteroidota bacterium]
MFGLMRKTSCDPPQQNLSWKRNHYCGTCKVMATEYGHGSRMFLNYDLVFLSELLTLLSQNEVSFSDEAFGSKNCFKLPSGKNIPLPHQFVAALGVIYADIKIKDNLQDKKSPIWKIPDFLFSKPVSKGWDKLTKWGVNPKLIQSWLNEQQIREKGKLSAEFNFYSEPTAEVTAHFFKIGAEIMKNKEASAVMEDLGRQFGKIIYWLDACEDFIRDKKQKAFNGLQVISGNFPESKSIQKMEEHFDMLKGKTLKALQDLPITDDLKRQFSARLESNLFIRVQAAFHKIETHVKDHNFAQNNPSLKLLEVRLTRRWQQAVEFAKIISSIEKRLQYYTLASMAFIIPKIKTAYPFSEIVYKKKDPVCGCNVCDCGGSEPCCTSDNANEAETCGNTCIVLTCGCGIALIVGIVLLMNSTEGKPGSKRNAVRAMRASRKELRQQRKEDKRKLRQRKRKLKRMKPEERV